VVISGPSGVGKDSVLRALKKLQLPIHIVVTATTRAPRPDETEGVDYFFVSTPEFEELIAKDELLEHARVYDDYKGIPKSQIRQAMASGKDIILRVDVQGAAKIRSLLPEAVLIFLVPANEEEWYQRLRDRHTETPESLQLRLDTARKELDQLEIFDYIVTNAQDRLDQAVNDIQSIINSEHHRVKQRRIEL
jgi:guanylate kinase